MSSMCSRPSDDPKPGNSGATTWRVPASVLQQGHAGPLALRRVQVDEGRGPTVPSPVDLDRCRRRCRGSPASSARHDGAAAGAGTAPGAGCRETSPQLRHDLGGEELEAPLGCRRRAGFPAGTGPSRFPTPSRSMLAASSSVTVSGDPTMAYWPVDDLFPGLEIEGEGARRSS